MMHSRDQVKQTQGRIKFVPIKGNRTFEIRYEDFGVTKVKNNNLSEV